MADLDSYVGSEADLEGLFRALGNEVRIEILRTLFRADEPLPFTTLRAEVGFEDSGNFNYHINQLTGHFINKGERGYELRSSGRAVVQAIRTGAIARDPEIPDRRIDLPCPFCGADQELSYSDEILRLRCSNCSGVIGDAHEHGTLMAYEFPAAGLRGRSEREVAVAAHQLYDSEVIAMTGGVCPHCSGVVEAELELCPEHDATDDDICEHCQTRYLAWGLYRCSNCNHSRKFPPWFNAFHLPEVTAFLYDVAGFNRAVPFPKLLTDDGTDLWKVTEKRRGTDPLEVAITLHLDDAHCTIVVDEQLEVTVGDKTVE